MQPQEVRERAVNGKRLTVEGVVSEDQIGELGEPVQT